MSPASSTERILCSVLQLMLIYQTADDEAVFLEIPFWACVQLPEISESFIEFVISSDDLCDISSSWTGPLRFQTPPPVTFDFSLLVEGSGGKKKVSF